MTTSSCRTHTKILNPQKTQQNLVENKSPLFPAEANNNKPTEPAVSDAANFISLQTRTQQGKKPTTPLLPSCRPDDRQC
jgi:hypothetical protein